MDILLFLKILLLAIAQYYIINFNTFSITGERQPMVWAGKVLWLCFILLANTWITVWSSDVWWWTNTSLMAVIIYTPGAESRCEQEEPGDWFAHRLMLLAVFVMSWLIGHANIAAL